MYEKGPKIISTYNVFSPQQIKASNTFELVVKHTQILFFLHLWEASIFGDGMTPY